MAIVTITRLACFQYKPGGLVQFVRIVQTVRFVSDIRLVRMVRSVMAIGNKHAPCLFSTIAWQIGSIGTNHTNRSIRDCTEIGWNGQICNGYDNKRAACMFSIVAWQV